MRLYFFLLFMNTCSSGATEHYSLSTTLTGRRAIAHFTPPSISALMRNRASHGQATTSDTTGKQRQESPSKSSESETESSRPPPDNNNNGNGSKKDRAGDNGDGGDGDGSDGDDDDDNDNGGGSGGGDGGNGSGGGDGSGDNGGGGGGDAGNQGPPDTNVLLAQALNNLNKCI